MHKQTLYCTMALLLSIPRQAGEEDRLRSLLEYSSRGSVPPTRPNGGTHPTIEPQG